MACLSVAVHKKELPSARRYQLALPPPLFPIFVTIPSPLHSLPRWAASASLSTVAALLSFSPFSLPPSPHITFFPVLLNLHLLSYLTFIDVIYYRFN